MGVIATFFGVLFVLLFAVAVTSNGALKGPDAFVLRWTVITLAVGLSGLAAWLRWRMAQPAAASLPSNQPKRTEQPRPVTAAPGPSIPKSNPAPPASAPIDVDVERVSKHAIVFRQHFPPRHDPTLSFWGGAPIVPAGFTWPRASGGQGAKPFTFLMQIDCAAVDATGRAGMLPDRGVLYFFLDLTWGQADCFRVMYGDAPDGDRWTPLQPPDDLGPAFGDQAVWMWKWPQSAEDAPRLLPKWTFDPVVIHLPDPRPEPDEDGAIAPVLWPGEKATAEILRAAQGEDVGNWLTIKDFTTKDGLRRPFANYPHDWRAVQICSGLLAEKLRHAHGLMGTTVYREKSKEEQEAVRQQIRDEALGWYARAVSQPAFAEVPQPDRDEFWSWLQTYAWLTRSVIVEAVTQSIEASLVASPEAAARIPGEVARRIHNRHALAVVSENGIYANTPHRMLAPPVDVQGNQWDRAKTHLLLLEISSNEGLGHHFGEGVIQFWITPADLKARRFDKVEQTTDAY